VRDVHRYDAPWTPGPEADRAVVLGELGTLGLEIKGHMWKESPNFRRFGYRCLDTRRELTDAYVELLRDLRPSVGRGLAGAVYTQTSDIGTEVNGLLTYNRTVVKMDIDRVNEALHLKRTDVSSLYYDLECVTN